MVLRNVRFLGAARRAALVDADAVVEVVEHLRPGVAEAEGCVDLDGPSARAALLALLWRGEWSTELARPVSGRSVLGPGIRAA